MPALDKCPEEWEFLELFEVEPIRTNPEEHWYYSDSCYVITRNGSGLKFGITPSYGDMTIELSSGTSVIFSLTALTAQSIEIGKNVAGVSEMRIYMTTDAPPYLITIDPLLILQTWRLG